MPGLVICFGCFDVPIVAVKPSSRERCWRASGDSVTVTLAVLIRGALSAGRTALAADCPPVALPPAGPIAARTDLTDGHRCLLHPIVRRP
jgi:hypothetical protein